MQGPLQWSDSMAGYTGCFLELFCEIPLIPYMTFFSFSLSSVLSCHTMVRTCCMKWLIEQEGRWGADVGGISSVCCGPLDALWGKQ